MQTLSTHNLGSHPRCRPPSLMIALQRRQGPIVAPLGPRHCARDWPQCCAWAQSKTNSTLLPPPSLQSQSECGRIHKLDEPANALPPPLFRSSRTKGNSIRSTEEYERRDPLHQIFTYDHGLCEDEPSLKNRGLASHYWQTRQRMVRKRSINRDLAEQAQGMSNHC